MINAQSKRYGGNVFLNSIIIMIVILKYVLLSNSYLFLKKIKFDTSITDKLIFVLCDKSY